jgi:hypothetical protein
MKASDVQELQRKLQKLQFELKQNATFSEDEGEDMNREEDYILEKIQEAKRDIHHRKLNIEEFEISTTLGT